MISMIQNPLDKVQVSAWIHSLTGEMFSPEQLSITPHVQYLNSGDHFTTFDTNVFYYGFCSIEILPTFDFENDFPIQLKLRKVLVEGEFRYFLLTSFNSPSEWHLFRNLTIVNQTMGSESLVFSGFKITISH
jgi:hypothetical protein